MSFFSVQRESRAASGLCGIHASPRTWDPITHTTIVPKTLVDDLGPSAAQKGEAVSGSRRAAFPCQEQGAAANPAYFELSSSPPTPYLQFFSFIRACPDLTPRGNDQVALAGRERSAPFPFLQAAVYGYHHKNRKIVPHGSPPPALAAA